MNPTRSRLRLPLHAPQPIHHLLRPPLFQRTTRQPLLPIRRKYNTRPLPKIAQPSLWTSLIPKFLRDRTRQSQSPSPMTPQSKEWNPASFYIIIFILIGSQAIRMIALKNEYTAYMRSTDAKIRLLREVIGRVKNGEDVDVEKLLGTGDQGMEREWDDVLREIEREDSLWHQKRKESGAEEQVQEDERKKAEAEARLKDPVIPAPVTEKGTGVVVDEATTDKTKRKVNFF
ncbi:hypothetical protein BJX61DRAFT_540740 [Aspergillus egyptiacus]|nr:hypothetical protein BJX61DRAFT_540740 [Aspergillus egyptiacus]